jgi:hypothetical protein
MFPAYADRPPDKDAPIHTLTYGVSEWHSLRDVAQEVAQVFGVVVAYKIEDED